ncbi:hypothetical protein GGD83_002852 [Rhodoblastus sphagnicola]|nr:hypothetical protein [Rhodoblastus sphagnicola]MBB4199041.1 hypothetical protein [Rhodoblastus sphagnicola]
MGLGPGGFDDLILDVGLCYPYTLAELRGLKLPLLARLWERARARLAQT